MSELVPTVSIYRRNNEPKLYIMHYAPIFDERGAYKGDGCWGELQAVDVDRFKHEGLRMIRESFQGFSTRRREYGSRDKQGFDLWSQSKRQQFFRQHADIGVTLGEHGSFRLDSMQPRIAGLSGASDESNCVLIPATCTATEFSDSVLKLLSA